MGLKDFFDDVIPNELKGNLGAALGIGTAAYFGYKYSPQIKDAVSGFIGTTGSAGFYGKGGAGNITEPSGVIGFVDKYKDEPLPLPLFTWSILESNPAFELSIINQSLYVLAISLFVILMFTYSS